MHHVFTPPTANLLIRWKFHNTQRLLYSYATMFKVKKEPCYNNSVNHQETVNLSINHLSIINLTSSSSSGGRRSTSLLFSSSSSSSSSRHTTAEPNVPMDLQEKSTRVLKDPRSAGETLVPDATRHRCANPALRIHCFFC